MMGVFKAGRSIQVGERREFFGCEYLDSLLPSFPGRNSLSRSFASRTCSARTSDLFAACHVSPSEIIKSSSGRRTRPLCLGASEDHDMETSRLDFLKIATIGG